ncbi:hypothetical protein GUJ93_ZPchr0002g23178 [Zizania palustris]|uniref:Uncharacterized protein n=1 Tax=Zizania palustris TaxID=103762 RepID=A0A8J5VCQ0_ZIZPA|nr:hypothetical protein GUJ93_ZPchr0002g23178 [Zizania palustris]
MMSQGPCPMPQYSGPPQNFAPWVPLSPPQVSFHQELARPKGSTKRRRRNHSDGRIHARNRPKSSRMKERNNENKHNEVAVVIKIGFSNTPTPEKVLPERGGGDPVETTKGTTVGPTDHGAPV